MPVKTQEQLRSELDATIFANPGGEITPETVHALLLDMIDSAGTGGGPNYASAAGSAVGSGAATASALALAIGTGIAVGSAAASSAITWDDSSTVPVVILIGESNAGGLVPNTGISTAAHPDVKILNNTSLVFESLQIGVNNLIAHTGLTDNATHGLELEMAAKASAGAWGTSPVYLIKSGQGGSNAGQWAVGSTYFNTFQSRWDAALTAITAIGKTPAPVIWMSLGSNDAQAGTDVGLFRVEMLNLIEDLRNYIGIYCPVIMTSLTPAVSSYWPNLTYVQQNALWTYLIDTTAANAFLLDIYHWDEAGMTILADAMEGITVDSTNVGLGTTYQTNKSIYDGSSVATGTVWDITAKGSSIRLLYGNRDAKGTGTSACVRGTTGKSSGKFYFEVQLWGAVNGTPIVGIMDNSTGSAGLNTTSPSNCAMTNDNGFQNIVGFFPGTGVGLGTLVSGDTIGCAVDATAKKVWLSNNNTWIGSGDPVAGTNPFASWPTLFSNPVFPAANMQNNFTRGRLICTGTTYTPPSGYSVWG